MDADGLILDQWSGVDHKDLGMVSGVPEYLSDMDARRMVAYRVFTAYIETVARNLLPEDSEHDETEWREYSDIGVLVDRVAAAVLGEDPEVGIVGADEEIPDQPLLPDFPEELPEGLDPAEAAARGRIRDIAVARWTAEVESVTDRWEADGALSVVLRERQDWLRQWAEDVRLLATLREAEQEYVVGLGDAAYVVAWDAGNKRPKVELMEPDAYIPVLDDAEPSAFPGKVHLVWQFDNPDPDEDEKLVRRITYELVPLEELGEGAGVRPAYLGADDVQTHVCLLSDGVWKLDDIESIHDVTSNPSFGWKKILGEGGEEIDLNQYNTGLDFIPVVHQPNTLSTSMHFGRSLICRPAQLLDEIAATDADAALSARWAAQPPLVVQGLPAGTESIDMTPGKGIKGDKVTTVDMAPNLLAIEKRGEALQKRLSVNMQVPDGLRGRVDDDQGESGVSRLISFTPFIQLIASRLRPAREAKIPLILKFAQRVAIVNAAESGISNATVYPSEFRFGVFMPQDLQSAVTMVRDLRSSKSISARTGLRILIDNGLPIDDIDAELDQIRAADGETALALADALGDSKYAAQYLGLEDFEAADDAGDEGDPGGIPVIDPSLPQ